jgi:hypothetical protein
LPYHLSKSFIVWKILLAYYSASAALIAPIHPYANTPIRSSSLVAAPLRYVLASWLELSQLAISFESHPGAFSASINTGYTISIIREPPRDQSCHGGEALKRGVDQSLLYLEVLGEMQDIVGALFGIASRWKILSLVG